MFQNELQSQHRVEPLPLAPASDDTEVQRKRMLIALGILLVALVGVVLKDWDFWFPPGSEVQEVVTRISRKNKNTAAVSTAAPAAANAPVNSRTVNAGDRVQLSPQTAQSVSVSVPPDYPLLARQMKVQGAVSLQALISKEGTIQELQILSGPRILAAAAREAVKQWHFKPYLQNGQPVETQAKITVNFTISTN